MSRKTFRKVFGAILIIASLVVASIPTNEVTADEALKTDFQIRGTTLLKYTGTATTVSVPDSVKVIGEEAFADNTNMVTLKLPDSLEKIEYAAFSGCSRLSQVIIPDKVEEIGTAAFCNNSSLSSFTLGKNTKKLGTGVFTGCTKLISISDNDYFTCIDGCIYDDDIEVLYQVLPNAMVKKSVSSNELVLMSTYDMPDTVTHIKPYSFYGCENIKSVIFSNNLTEIPAYAFSFCRGLSTLKIPYSVTYIDVKAFENCVNLEDVHISESVSFIHPTAFDGCFKLNIIAPEGSYAYEWYKSFDRTQVNLIDKEDNVQGTDVSGNASYERPPIEGLIGETIIVGRQAVFFLDSSALSVKGNDASLLDYSEIVGQMENVLQTETNGKGLSLPKFTVLGDKIANRAFYGDLTLYDYEISEGITSIGDFSFARSNLSEIEIPSSVTHIGYGAFYHCDNLSKIVVPSSVTDIEPSAFSQTRMMDNFRQYGTDDFLIMGDGILVAYKGLNTKVSIPDGVKQIGPEAFKDHKEIMEVSFPDTLIRVCEDAFSGCINLRNVTGGMNLDRIEDRAFYKCPLNTIRIVDTVSIVGVGAYSLNQSSLDDQYKAVVFQGDVLPIPTFQKTATRLTNDSYRIDSFDGVKVAIVNSESVNRVGTVLDRDYSGFSGLVCVITEPNNSYFNGTLHIIDCTLNSEEAASFTIPKTIYLYGKGYNFLEDESSSVLEMAKAGAFYATDENEYNFVSFTGSDDLYRLNISKNDNANQNIKDAYMRIYADSVPANFTTYDIELFDPTSNISISKFGNQKLKINIPLPDNMPTTNLHIICLDEDGQLEDLPFSVSENLGRLNVFFDISHTGVYGLYSFNSTAVSKYALDDSPDTGDPVHPKWFLSLGLLSIGAVLILYKGKRVI